MPLVSPQLAPLRGEGPQEVMSQDQVEILHRGPAGHRHHHQPPFTSSLHCPVSLANPAAQALPLPVFSPLRLLESSPPFPP